MIYLDNAATTRPYDEVREVVADMMHHTFGNPSSLHHLGVRAEEVLERSRQVIAAALQVQPREIIFTSGGTETNNMVLKGTARAHRRKGKHIIASAVEHQSVLKTLQTMEQEGYEVTLLPVDADGLVSLQALEDALREDTILVSIMHANNETGAIQPVERISEILRRHPSPALLHADAVQSFGKVPLHPRASGIDLLTLSAHKVHGPKGVGALYRGENMRLTPLVEGGEQEQGLRSGTQNLPSVAGFARAVEMNFEGSFGKQNHMLQLRDALKDRLAEIFEEVRVNTPGEQHAAPHILNVSFPGLKGEVLLRNLEEKSIYVSTGSACTSGKNKPSHVLKAMGLTKEEVEGALRFSFSWENHQEEVDQVMEHMEPAVKRLKKLIR